MATKMKRVLMTFSFVFILEPVMTELALVLFFGFVAPVCNNGG